MIAPRKRCARISATWALFAAMACSAATEDRAREPIDEWCAAIRDADELCSTADEVAAPNALPRSDNQAADASGATTDGYHGDFVF